MSFATDTALTPAGEGRWTATYDERWKVVRGPFGGFLAALLARALVASTRWPPRTLAIHFLDAPEPGEIEIASEVLRAGRSTDSLALRIDQGGRPMARALASAGAWRGDEPAWQDLQPPQVPPPEACTRWERRDPMPPFFGELDLRWVEGSLPVPPGGDAYNVMWVSAGALDAAAVAAIGDVVLPPAFGRLGRFAVVPTLDLTIHWRAPVPEGEAWVLAAHRSDHSEGGTWTSDGELWSRDGRLLAQARQLAMIRA